MAYRREQELFTDYLSEATSGQGVMLNIGNTHGGFRGGAGTSSSKFTMTGVSKSFLSFYITTADTSDSNRVLYARLYLTGAAGGGEAVRAFATGSGVGLTALRGAHISASISGSGTVTGEMMASKHTLHVPNSTLGGTASGICSEIYADGTSAAISNGAYFRATLSGASAAGLAGVPLMAIDGITVGSAGDGKTVDAISGDKAVTHLALIKINNVSYYIMLRNAV